jgi:hypothetical protein
VAVIGGATAGAEVAGYLAERGVDVVVFEQGVRPYGKIEDGLPRWHAALRRKEYQIINSKLGRPEVRFVPCTKIGKDLAFDDLANAWGFSAVVLACGAWRDRPLPIPGAENYVDRGLVYQNPFIIWFNHHHETDYRGPRYETPDRALVVGGGLASIDVAKVLMLETTLAALRPRGINVDVVDLEHKGIPAFLTEHGLDLAGLGIAGCTIVYRRTLEDMPLAEIPEDATPEKAEKVRATRRRILENARAKYGFSVEPLAAPEAFLNAGARAAGLRCRRTRVEGARLVNTDEMFELPAPLIVSSIGSIPEPIAGIPMKGELFQFSDGRTGQFAGYPNVFSVGNVVTGRGNIVASRRHAREISEASLEAFLGLAEQAAEADIAEALSSSAREQAELVGAEIVRRAPIREETRASILQRVRARQQAIGYEGYAAWIAKVTPPGFV